MPYHIRIVLVNTSHQGNIGATARAMKNMGLRELYLVSPKQAPGEDAYRRAASADDLLSNAHRVQTLEQALSGCIWVAGVSARTRTIRWPMLTPEESTTKAREMQSRGDVAFVFGREDIGLTNEELEYCNAIVTIPADPAYSSLNLAQAVQVIAYELFKNSEMEEPVSSETPKDIDDNLADIEEISGFYQHLQDAIIEIGFIDKNNPENIMRRLKGLFNRSHLTKREINILRGILSAATGRKSANKK